MQKSSDFSLVIAIEGSPKNHHVTNAEKGSLEHKSCPHNCSHYSTKSLSSECGLTSRRGSSQLSQRFFNWLLLPPALLLLVLSGYSVAFCRDSRRGKEPVTRPKDSDYYDAGAPFAPFKTQRLWGAYSPYYSVEEYRPPPDDCQLTQVNIVRRWGETSSGDCPNLSPRFSDTARVILHLGKLYTLPKLFSGYKQQNITRIRGFYLLLLMNTT